MCLSRLVGRNGVKPEEVCAYRQRDLDDNPVAEPPSPAAAAEYQKLEFESLDIIELAPLLLLMAAHEKALELINNAEAEAVHHRDQALRENAQQGREEAKKELLPALVAFADAGQSLIVFEEQFVSRYTPQIVELALAIAEKVIGKAVEDDPQITAVILERAKQEVVDAKQMRVWLHPVDLKILAELRPDLIKMGDESGRTIEVLASEEISRGGCRLETESGLVDATVPTQLDEIRRQLLDQDVVSSSSAPSNKARQD